MGIGVSTRLIVFTRSFFTSESTCGIGVTDFPSTANIPSPRACVGNTAAIAHSKRHAALTPDKNSRDLCWRIIGVPEVRCNGTRQVCPAPENNAVKGQQQHCALNGQRL